MSDANQFFWRQIVKDVLHILRSVHENQKINTNGHIGVPIPLYSNFTKTTKNRLHSCLHQTSLASSLQCVYEYTHSHISDLHL